MSRPGIFEGKMGHREGDVLVAWGLGTTDTPQAIKSSTNCAHNGSNLAPVGNISLRDDATGAITYNFIPLGINTATQIHVTVPLGKVMYVPAWHADPSSNKPIRSYLLATADFHNKVLTPNVFQAHNLMVVAKQHRFDIPLRFPAKCDVKISSQVIGTGNGECGGGIEYWLEAG